MYLPPTSHFIFIPAVLVLGVFLGFVLGARATRDAYLAEQRRAEERAARQAARAAAKPDKDPAPPV